MWILFLLQLAILGFLMYSSWLLRGMRNTQLRSIRLERDRRLREEKLKAASVGQPAGIDIQPLQPYKRVEASPEDWEKFHRECEEAFNQAFE